MAEFGNAGKGGGADIPPPNAIGGFLNRSNPENVGAAAGGNPGGGKEVTFRPGGSPGGNPGGAPKGGIGGEGGFCSKPPDCRSAKKSCAGSENLRREYIVRF